MSNLYSLEYEKNLLSGLLQFPDTWGDVASRLVPNDFSKVNGAVYSALAAHLAKSQTISATILGEQLKAMSIVFEDIEPYDYLKALELIPVKKEEVENLAREVKKLALLRDYEQRCVDIKTALPTLKTKSFDEITSFIDKKMATTNVAFGINQTQSMFEGMEAEFEERLITPPDASKMGYLGPFKSLNDVIGPLSYASSFTSIISRSGGGKSALSWFYNTWMADKYKLPCLHLDCGEMTRNELRERAVASLSTGRVPYGEVVNGTWGKNKVYSDIIRGEIWPKVKELEKIGYWYHNVGDMSPDEIVSFVRRFYFSHCERGSFLLINLDYLKAFDMSKTHRNEVQHQLIGQFVKSFKSLTTNEICAGTTAGLQANRMGSYMNKDAANINDSEETGALSDTIFQQSSHQFILRHKVPDELVTENGLYGNVRLIPTKKRRLTGPRAIEMLHPILLPSGKYTANYFNLQVEGGFHYEDRGIQSDVMQQTGRTAINIDRPISRPGTLL